VSKIICSFAILLFAPAVVAGPKGTVPRPSAAQYPLHAEGDGVHLGAKLLSREEARKTFVSDVNRCCIVVEIALYPNQGTSLNISLNDFALRQKNAESAIKPSSPGIVASSVQQKAEHDRDVTVSTSTGVGYEHRTSGVYTQAGVGVAIGDSNGPGVSNKDRDVMETELTEKGLSEGVTTKAVAGYVYFPVQPKKKGDYQLEYVVEEKKLVVPVHVE
jgi:hypothetical protein